MQRFRVVAAVVCIIFLSSIVLIPFANADWMMFRSDPSHSGAGTGNPVLNPTLIWSYATGSNVFSSPAVDGGVVYIGSYDGNVYALGGTPPLTVSISPTSVTLDVGQSQLFTATPSGSSGTYTGYQWYVDGSAKSGQTASTFNYSPASAGSYSITATVNDSLGATSPQSTAASVTVDASPTVSIVPPGPLSMDVGQSQMFTATASGGSGTINYQWYLDGTAVSSNSASYSYTATGTSHTVTCKVTDSASTPVTSPASNAVSVTVNPAPTPTPTPVPTVAPTSVPTAAPTSVPTTSPTPMLTPTATAAAFVFGVVDWLIVILVIVIVLIVMILVWYRRRRKPETQQTQKTYLGTF